MRTTVLSCSSFVFVTVLATLQNNIPRQAPPNSIPPPPPPSFPFPSHAIPSTPSAAEVTSEPEHSATPAPPANPPPAPPTSAAVLPLSSARSQASSPSPATNGTILVPPPPSTTVSLESTNPTARPLSEIVANAPSAPTHAVPTSVAPGDKPSGLRGIPGLPNANLLNPADYPPLDRPPPEDSPEVEQWYQEVMNSGVSIPDIAPTNPGGCPNNTEAASDPSICWWTCSGCTAPTDVSDCPDKMTWGLTYDDGPSLYTPDLLDYLDENKLKTTFFVVGSRVISYPHILQAEYMANHQIAVHTWSHYPLTTLSTRQIIAELGWSKKVIYDTIGVTPNMMRPPFGDIDNRVRAICMAMNLIPVMWTRLSPQATFNTDDFDIHSGLTTVENVLGNWKDILGNVSTMDHGFIVLEHDLFQQTVEVATGYILPDALAHKPPFTIEPVISCLRKPLADAYVQTNDNVTNPPPANGGLPTGAAQATGGGTQVWLPADFSSLLGGSVAALFLAAL